MPYAPGKRSDDVKLVGPTLIDTQTVTRTRGFEPKLLLYQLITLEL